MTKIALICAIPQESRPILRRLCNPSRVKLYDIPIWSCTTSKLHVILAETGIGMTRASEAAKNIIKFANPDIVISTGFCGAIKPGLCKGDIVLAERVFTYNTALHPSILSLDSTLLDRLFTPGKCNFHRGTFITTKEMVAKCYIESLLNDQSLNPVLEMESYAIAEVCSCTGIPFAAIRAVSDTADQDPQSVCIKIFAADMKINMLKMIKSMIAAPRISLQLLHLYTDAEAAGRALGEAIEYSLDKLQ